MPLESKYQNTQSLQEETPDHAECIGLAEQDDIAAAPEDCSDLENSNQIDEAVSRAVAAVRLAKPRREYMVFGDAIQNAVRANHRGVHGARKNQQANHDDEDMKCQP